MKLVYLSPVHWGSYKQRPHFMVQTFLAKGIESVLWVNPYPARLPNMRDLIRHDDQLYRQCERSNDLVHELSIHVFPVEPIQYLRAINNVIWRGAISKILKYLDGDPFILGIGRPVIFGIKLLRSLSPTASFYDAMDDFPEFYKGLARNSIKDAEQVIASEVDTVYVSSSYLKKKFIDSKMDPILLNNACCMSSSSFGRPKKRQEVIGYVGSVGSWFDWDLVCRLAEDLPQFIIRVIGPVFQLPNRSLPVNIELLSPCSHRAAIEHMREFAAGLIPFRKNDLTKAVDPIKYYEYRSLGLPTLSTSFGEMVFRGGDDGVFFIDRHEGFSNIIEKAIAWAKKKSEKNTREFYYKNNWACRFSCLLCN